MELDLPLALELRYKLRNGHSDWLKIYMKCLLNLVFRKRYLILFTRVATNKDDMRIELPEAAR